MFFKRLFKKKYRKSYEYCVNLSDIKIIKIKENFKLHNPNPFKMYWKRKYFKENGKFNSKILLDRDFELVDGYTSYLLAKENGMKHVEVYFVD